MPWQSQKNPIKYKCEFNVLTFERHTAIESMQKSSAISPNVIIKANKLDHVSLMFPGGDCLHFILMEYGIIQCISPNPKLDTRSRLIARETAANILGKHCYERNY